MSGTDLKGDADIATVFAHTVNGILEKCAVSANGKDGAISAIQAVDLEMNFSKVGISKSGFLWSSNKVENTISIRLATRIYVSDVGSGAES